MSEILNPNTGLPQNNGVPQMPAPTGFRQWDYKQFLNKNIVGYDAEVPPFDKPPSDPKDYAIYRQHYEGMMQEITQGQGTLKVTVNCEYQDEKGFLIRMRKPRDDHFGSSAGLMYACDHIIAQDPVNPEDVYCVPFMRDGFEGYHLCKTCWRLLEQRKLDISIGVMGKCGLCIAEAVARVMQKDPARFHDLRYKKC